MTLRAGDVRLEGARDDLRDLERPLVELIGRFGLAHGAGRSDSD